MFSYITKHATMKQETSTTMQQVVIREWRCIGMNPFRVRVRHSQIFGSNS